MQNCFVLSQLFNSFLGSDSVFLLFQTAYHRWSIPPQSVLVALITEWEQTRHFSHPAALLNLITCRRRVARSSALFHAMKGVEFHLCNTSCTATADKCESARRSWPRLSLARDGTRRSGAAAAILESFVLLGPLTPPLPGISSISRSESLDTLSAVPAPLMTDQNDTVVSRRYGDGNAPILLTVVPLEIWTEGGGRAAQFVEVEKPTFAYTQIDSKPLVLQEQSRIQSLSEG